MAATKKTGAPKSKADRKVAAAKPDQMLVRIKKYDPKKGYVLQRYTAFGVLFEEKKGWYTVDKYVADYLSKIKQRPDPEHTLFAFDVCTAAEAQALNDKENELAIRQGRATPHMAHKVIPRDVRTGTDMGPKPQNAPPPGYDLTTDDLRPPPREPVARSMRPAAN